MNKNMKLIIGTVAGIVVIGLITFTVLFVFFPKDKASDEPKTSSPASSKEIIDALKNPETIAALSNEYIQPETQVVAMSAINYTKAGAYMVTVPATDFVQYEQKDSEKTENAASTVTSIESFLLSKGLSKSENSSASSLTYTAFNSENTTCQLINLPKMSVKPAFLSVSCTSKEVVAKVYEEIDKLLALYTSASSAQIKPTTVQKVSIAEGNKTLVTLNAFGDTNNTKTLLFVAIDTSWEYIGERPLSAGTTEQNPTGINRDLSKELQTKIADPKYQGFLKKYIL